MSAAEDLAIDFSPLSELERVLRRCTELLGCDAGSICSVDEAAGTYRKEKVIAERLVLSVKTVEKHAGAVLRKTGARNRAELAALAGRARPARPPGSGGERQGRESPPASWGLPPIRAVGALRYFWDIPATLE